MVQALETICDVVGLSRAAGAQMLESMASLATSCFKETTCKEEHGME